MVAIPPAAEAKFDLLKVLLTFIFKLTQQD